MKRNLTTALYMLSDAIICVLAIYFATWLRFDGAIPPEFNESLYIFYVISVFSVLFISTATGAYNSLWAYVGFSELFRQGFIVIFSCAVFLTIKYTHLFFVSGSITVIYGGLLFLATSAVRGIPRLNRWIQAMHGLQKGEMRRVVVVGAGDAGAMLIKRLRDNFKEGIYPVAAVDDDPYKQGIRIAGIPVCGKVSDIVQVCGKRAADEIIIAIPSASEKTLSYLYDQCAQTRKPVKLFQSVVDIEKFLAGDRRALKEVSIEDLLFRESVKPNMSSVYTFLEEKTVLVTGGAGSIGSELCRQVLEHGCQKLIILDIHENGLFELNEEFKHRFNTDKYVLVMGSIRDKARLDQIFKDHKPDIVIHAAAHKHVPMMELNPFEAVKNNVLGTRNVLHCCTECHVKKFILISTDKAVNPTNIMGASKRLAEMLVQTMNGHGGCEMASVRFGNVLGSNGSVIPTFKKQIAAGGPVTVTHRDMKRYFMTIPEAVSLVLTAGALAHGGELFVLNMGKPIQIYDLACDLIRLSGLEVDRDIKIEITGLRPGEKLFEELSLDCETVDRTSHEKIFIVHSPKLDSAEFKHKMAIITRLAQEESDEARLRSEVFEMISVQTDEETDCKVIAGSFS